MAEKKLTATKEKVLDVLSSKNFLTSVIALISLALAYNGIKLEDADTLYEYFNKGGTELIIAVGTFLFNSGSKIVSKVLEKNWSWDFIKSTNFKTGVITVVVIVVSSFFNELTIGVVSSIVLNIYNILIHMVEPPTGLPLLKTDPTIMGDSYSKEPV